MSIHTADAPEAATVPEPADPLVRITLELLAEARAADRRRDAADEALKAHLPARAGRAYRAAVDAIDDARGAWADVHVAELARHLPGLAPTIRLLWAHVIDERPERIGACCTDGGPVEV